MTKIFEKELDWLRRVIDLRFKLYFNTDQEPEHQSIYQLKPPKVEGSSYADLIGKHQLGFEERLAIALCLATYLCPQLLDVFFTRNKIFERPFTEFGGLVTDDQSGFIPTGETLLFILAGSDISKKIKLLFLINEKLLKSGLVELLALNSNLPKQKGMLRLSQETEVHLLYDQAYHPEFSVNFPATRLSSQLEWKEDLILPQRTKMQLEEIKLWIENRAQLLEEWKLEQKLRPGYRSLFYGPPGTGKKFTASLLGKETGYEVYRINLSVIIAKYIGETEKNLAKIFNTAAQKNWILFFDEADALLGKKTTIQNVHDGYANQAISFLLQRLETFAGISIFAINLKDNIDEAFTRRFESLIYFPLPGPEQRFQLWTNNLPHKDQQKVDSSIDFYEIAKKYELSGGAIMNVIRYASLWAIANSGMITNPILVEGIRREYEKQGRIFS
ncbi:MAG: ATP-binding protein [Bacteroidota bacterium]